MPIFNVYINGTDEDNGLNIGGITSLANLLQVLTLQNEQQSSICLNGCGVNNSHPLDLGGLFTFHLGRQVNQVVTMVQEKLRSDEKLTLNLYGFSRGGAAVFWICKKLADVPAEKLEINVASLEPVPGNFIWASNLGKKLGINLTLTNIIADLRDCKNIKNALVLFTNQYMLPIMGHAPVLPLLPSSTNKRVDVVPGCHKGAELFYMNSNGRYAAYKNSDITFHYVTRHLKAWGTEFHEKHVSLADHLKDTNESSISSLNIGDKTDNREMHFNNNIITREKDYNNLLDIEIENDNIIEPEISKPIPLDPNKCRFVVQNPFPQSHTDDIENIDALDESAKKLALQNQLRSYSEKPQLWISSLARNKRKLAIDFANSPQDFNTICDGLSQAHQQLSQQANKSWIKSNRWKIRQNDWDEEKNSEMGRVISRFKK
jgi:hypothetical protein